MSTTLRRSAAAGPAVNWLPPFCSWPTLFAVMVVAQLVALIVVLAPDAQLRPVLPRLGVVSVFVQWQALLAVAVLCSLRGFLQRLPATLALQVAWLLAVTVNALGAAVVASIDHALLLGLTVPAGQMARFILANAVLSALISAALLRYLYVLERWRDGVNAAAKAQVEALQARIRPHFLFNSMNTIISLVRSEPALAERTVEDLSDLFRAALGDDRRPWTLGQELELVEHYLRIERLRLGERLCVDMDTAQLPQGLAMPRLLLQPLVENAVYHGIEPRAVGGTVGIHGQLVDGRVHITISNPYVAVPRGDGNRHALANVQARIGYHFGGAGSLVAGPVDGRFTVRLSWPCKEP